MAKRQIYRGNPVQKLYYLLDDYTGGIDRSKVDENMDDFEFREMVNTDISEKGILQKRKGFEYLEKLNDMLSEKMPFSSTSYPYNPLLFKVVKNENRTFEKLLKNEALSENDNGSLVIITAGFRDYNEESLIYFYSYKLAVSGGVSSFDIISSKNLDIFNLPISGKKDNIIKTKDFVNKTYFSLNDLHDNLRGICYYDKDKEDFFTIEGEMKQMGSTIWETIDYPGAPTNKEAYKPKPYEINSLANSNMSAGFNVLADSPLLYIDDQKTGLVSLRSIILTDFSGNYIEKIPTSGQFIINIIKTGRFTPENLQIKLKNQDNDYIPYKLVHTYEVTTRKDIETTTFTEGALPFAGDIEDLLLDAYNVGDIIEVIEYEPFKDLEFFEISSSLGDINFNDLDI